MPGQFFLCDSKFAQLGGHRIYTLCGTQNRHWFALLGQHNRHHVHFHCFHDNGKLVFAIKKSLLYKSLFHKIIISHWNEPFFLSLLSKKKAIQLLFKSNIYLNAFFCRIFLSVAIAHLFEIRKSITELVNHTWFE